eukprot:TRINITY_DN6707_c0_g1_i1.p1 TRINITY_DN6707_c0_g1~~TRINITY_DN6707_c0_g1_i1.p1  ORF type:complete len:719 (-),score=141.38 TRINITY_DN6707_c0_g1_i1:72-2228(-)
MDSIKEKRDSLRGKLNKKKKNRSLSKSQPKKKKYKFQTERTRGTILDVDFLNTSSEINSDESLNPCALSEESDNLESTGRSESPRYACIYEDDDEDTNSNNVLQPHGLGAAIFTQVIEKKKKKRKSVGRLKRKKKKSKESDGSKSIEVDDEPKVVIGTIMVDIMNATNIRVPSHASSKFNSEASSFIKVIVEDKVRKTRIIEKNKDPVFEDIFEFPITDINGDVVIKIYNHKIASNVCFGQVVIPIGSLLGVRAPLGKVMHRYKIFPYSSKDKKYHNTIQKEHGTGMERPKKSIGFITCALEADIEGELLKHYLLEPPEIDTEYVDEIDPIYLKSDIQRLKRFVNIPVWVYALAYCRSWGIASNVCFGQVVIPIGSLLGVRAPLGKVMHRYKIFPYSSKDKKYHNTIQKEHGTGMERPKKSIGFITCALEADIEGELLKHYLLEPPEIDTEYVDEIDPIYLKSDIQRLKRFVNIPVWVYALAYCRSWEKKQLSFSVLMCFIIQWYIPMWLYPLFLASMIVGLGILSNELRFYAYIAPWNDEIDPDHQSALEKLKKIRSIVVKAQNKADEMLSHLERIKNILNWSDPRISFIASAFIILIGVIVSILCFLVGTIFYFISIRFIIMVVGVLYLLPAFIKKYTYDFIISQIRKYRKEPEKTIRTIEGSTRKIEQFKATIIDYISLSKTMAINYFYRIPDDKEMVHRIIAGMQVRDPHYKRH